MLCFRDVLDENVALIRGELMTGRLVNIDRFVLHAVP